MDAVSCCPLRVGSLLWQPGREAWTLTVVCKATFRLEPGTSVLVETQDEVTPRDVFWGDSPGASLRAASDLAPLKSTIDLVVVGSAFAPPGRHVHSVVARVSVDDVDKAIEVWSDRVFGRDGGVFVGSPFARLPLRHERAAFDATWNPLGIGADAPPDAYGSVPIPNLQPVGQQIERRGDPIASVGFGPISPDWPARARLAPPGWSPRAIRERPLPADFDPGFFAISPIDQRLFALGPRERILLEHLHPVHARLETRLPGVRPVARLAGGGDAITLRADTLVIDSDRALAVVTYRGSIALSHPNEAGRIEVRIASVEHDEPEDGDDEEGATIRMAGDERGTEAGVRDSGAALPFQQPRSPWVGYRKPEPIPSRREDTGTIMGGRASARDVVPSGWNVSRNDTPVLSIAEAVVGPKIAPERAEFAPEADEAPPSPVEPKEAAETAPSITTTTGASPTVEAELPLAAFPIERCAAISASIARVPSAEAEILAHHQLEAPTWLRLERHHADALREEAARAKAKLLQRFDDAYVAQLERERGPIEVAEYARLTAAAERGKSAEVLAELGIPAKASMRIERVWLRKIVADPKLGKSVARAVTEAKNA